MTAKLTEFQRRQLDKIETATEIEVTDLLKVVLDDIEKKEISPDGILIIAVRRKEHEDKLDISRYTAGLTRGQSIALLEAQKAILVKQWSE